LKDYPGVDEGHPGLTASAMILFAASKSKFWNLDRPEPMLIRVKILPARIGFDKVDNDHAELAAIVMAEGVLPRDAISLGITDSTVAHSKVQALQERDYASGRRKIRNVYSGVCKAYTLQLERDTDGVVFPRDSECYKAEVEDRYVQNAKSILRSMQADLQAQIVQTSPNHGHRLILTAIRLARGAKWIPINSTRRTDPRAHGTSTSRPTTAWCTPTMSLTKLAILRWA
jgi:hypothetical protein